MIRSLSALQPLSPTPNGYIGRFAPSPTGPLHFGSLVSALASYLDAHHNGGLWLVRMEDIDPPREQPGAADSILQSLDAHGLHWHGPVLYQSQRLDAYQDVLQAMIDRNWVYRCDCTRQDLQLMGGVYSGRCRTRSINLFKPHALRLKLYDLPGIHASDTISFADFIQGGQLQNLRTQAGDQIVKRKDGLFAYQLAVVVDDIAQQISHIIRGCDLLDVTARQMFLFKLLGAKTPAYGHVPVVLNHFGQKLSKQNLATPLDSNTASNNLWRALGFLGQNPPLELCTLSVDDIVSWGVTHWGLNKVHPDSRSVTTE